MDPITIIILLGIGAVVLGGKKTDATPPVTFQQGGKGRLGGYAGGALPSQDATTDATADGLYHPVTQAIPKTGPGSDYGQTYKYTSLPVWEVPEGAPDAAPPNDPDNNTLDPDGENDPDPIDPGPDDINGDRERGDGERER